MQHLIFTPILEVISPCYSQFLRFSDVVSGREPACQWRRNKRLAFDPKVEKITWGTAWQPTPVFLLENPMARTAWRVTVTGSQRAGHAWSDLTSMHALTIYRWKGWGSAKSVLMTNHKAHRTGMRCSEVRLQSPNLWPLSSTSSGRVGVWGLGPVLCS